MATQDDTGGRPSIILSVRRCDRPFTRKVITAARDGLRDELDRFADQLCEPTSRLLKEEAAYGRLLDGLDGTPVFPDAAMYEAVAGLAQAVDRENQYPRVVAEHDALHGLLDQVQEAVA